MQIKKVIPLLAVVIALLVCVMTLSPNVNAQVVSGDWSYETYGNGIALTAYNGTATDVYVPSKIDDQPVIKLGDGLFQNNDALNSVTLGAGVTEIGKRAFYDCDNLVCIVTNEQLTTIGDEAFYSCDVFNSIILGDVVTQIGTNAFVQCPKLTVWCNDSNAAHLHAQANNIAFILMRSDATPQIYELTGITYYIMNGEAVAIGSSQDVTSVKIPAVVEGYPVTELRGTFQECSVLSSVTLPDTLKRIGEKTFYNCAALESIVIPDGVTEIGSNAFYSCDLLQSIRIPDGVTAIADRTFYFCTDLVSVELPDSVESIGDRAFGICQSLKDVNIPVNLKTIGNDAFSSADITELVFPDGLTTIGRNAFCSCSYLKSVQFPASVTTIGDGAFAMCGLLTNVQLPEKLSDIANELFADCESLQSVSIPQSVKTIGYWAFQNCTELKSVVIPEAVTSIDSDAFTGCTALETLIIPASVTSISSSSFDEKTILLVYENSPAHSLAEEYGLLYVIFDGVNIPKLHTVNNVLYCVVNDEAIAVKTNGSGSFTLASYVGGYPVTELRSVYKNNSSVTSVSLPSKLKRIANDAFSHCSSLKSITIPSGVEYIGESAFYYCTSLQSITLPQSLVVLGDQAFLGCTALQSIQIPKNVTTIGDYAFYACSVLTDVEIAEGVTEIGVNAFYNCSAVDMVVIPESVTSMDESSFHENVILLVYEDSYAHTFAQSNNLKYCLYDGVNKPGIYTSDGVTYFVLSDEAYAVGFDGSTSSVTIPSYVQNRPVTQLQNTFQDCENLVSVVLPNTIQSIGYKSFYNCRSLKSVNIPNSVTVIGEYAFDHCYVLKSLNIPDSVTQIGKNAFAWCYALETVRLPSDLKVIEESLFTNCDALVSLQIPQSVTRIGTSAFSGCNNLQSITIPDSVTVIGDRAFYSCDSLQSVTLPAGLKRLNDDLFYKCTALTSVTVPEGVTYIGENAFYNCVQLKTVIIPDTVRQFGRSAFDGCAALESIHLPNGVTALAAWMFDGCVSLKNVEIPDSVTAMEYGAFARCTGLTSVKIPAGVKTIDYYVFTGCTGLRNVEIPEGVSSIKTEAFDGCSSLYTLLIPESATSVAADAFASSTVLLVYEDSCAHTVAADHNLLHFVLRKTLNPEIAYGTSISGKVQYMDGAMVEGAQVEILDEDGTVKETVTTDANGAYAFTYAEVGRYTIRVTDAAGNTASTMVSVKRMNAFDVFLAGDTNLTLKRGWSVSGTVSEDAVTVTITDSKGNVLDRLDTTDGSFAFANIPNGTYVVKAESASGSVVTEITVFNSDLTGIYLQMPQQIASIWGYTKVETRDGTASCRNWVSVTVYDLNGVVVAQAKTDREGKFIFENLSLGSYRLTAQTAEFRPDHHGRPFDRSYTLTGFAYADATVAGSYQADIILKEVHEQETDISGKVTAHGQNQDSEVILRDVQGNEYAQYITGKNGKYSFVNIPDGVYIITAITPAKGMGYTVITVRDSVVYGNTDITVYKDGKLTQQEMEFYADLGQCDSAEGAKNLRNRIAQEKRQYDSLSNKEKKQLSKEYVETLNRLVEWAVDCEYMTPDGVEVSNGGTVVSGDELEKGDSVSFGVSIEKAEDMLPSENGVENAADFIYYDMMDSAGDGQICQYYEISMNKYVDGSLKPITSVTKDTDATGKFRITMPIPEEYRGRKHYTMLHVHNGETVVLADLDDDPNTITFEVDAFSTFALTSADEILIPVARAQVWEGTELYGNYISLEEAVNGCESQMQYVKLVEDTVADLTLQRDLYIDLNGFDLTGTIVTNGYKIYGMDSTTNGYSCQNMGYFNCVDENGAAIVPQKQFAGAENMRYMTIATENGYTFHRFFLGITYMSLKPSVTGFGYKAEFYGDELVQSQVSSVGYSLWLTENHVVCRNKDGFQNTLTLRLQNFDVQNYGEVPVNACVIMTLVDGTVIESAVQSCTLRNAVESVNANYADFTEAQLAAVRAMIQVNPTMQAWIVENIYKKDTV